MPDKWPVNPDSTEIDTYIDWMSMHPDAVTTCNLGMVAKFPRNAIDALFNRYKQVFDRFPQDIQQAIENRFKGLPVAPRLQMNPTTIIPVKISSLSARLAELEVVRAGIPVEECLNILCQAATTGAFDGVDLSAKERIDVLKYLVGRVLPDAKSVDTVERNVNLDRVRRTAKSVTQEELKGMTKQELLDIMEVEQ